MRGFYSTISGNPAVTPIGITSIIIINCATVTMSRHAARPAARGRRLTAGLRRPRGRRWRRSACARGRKVSCPTVTMSRHGLNEVGASPQEAAGPTLKELSVCAPAQSELPNRDRTLGVLAGAAATWPTPQLRDLTPRLTTSAPGQPSGETVDQFFSPTQEWLRGRGTV